MGCVHSDTAGSKAERQTAAQIDAELRSDHRRKAPELRLLLLGMIVIYDKRKECGVERRNKLTGCDFLFY